MSDAPAVESASFSIDDAVESIKAPAPPADRAPDGKFAAKADDPAKVVDMAGKPIEDVKAEAPADDEEDPEFEIPAAEDGKEPVRLKFSKIYEGYEKAAKLEAELTEVKTKTQSVPAEYQSALQDIVSKRQEYIENLGVLQKAINPQQPSPLLIDPNSEHYNPDAYAQYMRQYQHQTKILEGIRADIDKQKSLQDEQKGTLSKARLAGEMEKMAKVWPEFSKDAKVRQEAANVLADMGFTKEEIDGIDDHRHLRIVKDALELRALKAKSAEAVKVVRAKPKLVKGAARSTTTGTSPAKSAAIGRFNQSFSIEDAVDALMSR